MRLESDDDGPQDGLEGLGFESHESLTGRDIERDDSRDFMRGYLVGLFLGVLLILAVLAVVLGVMQ